MKFKLFAILGHSMVMVGRTIKNYVMLSMTVVLSFSILLCYLLITDSNLYNSYKSYLSSDGRIVFSSVTSPERMEALFTQIEKIGAETYYYVQEKTNIMLDSFWENGESLRQQINIIPSHVWGVYDSFQWASGQGIRPRDVIWLDGRETEGTEVHLNANEILLERALYDYLNLDEMEEPTYEIRFHVYTEDGKEIPKAVEAKVVGLVETASWAQQKDGSYILEQATIYTSQATMADMGKLVLASSKDVIIRTDEPVAVKNAIISLGLDSYITMYELKQNALAQMRMNTETKAIIAMVLCVLLAINLYGSFSNALQSRKFEVGVKRAIGASNWIIIRQFLWEGMIVMLGNILLSIMIVMDGALIYKYFYQLMKKEVWTIYLSGASIAIFGVVTISLTLIFSLVFAIQTTQVEIVQYLKAE